MNPPTIQSAFPVAIPPSDDGTQITHLGMTLRDYFAAQAMAGFNKGMVDYGWGDEVLIGHARQAYAIADALMEARHG